MAVKPKQFLLRDIETLRAVADPLRLRLLMLMAEPHTAKQAAAALDVPPTRLYYHLQILEEHGLIRVVRRRRVSGIEERTYQSAGNSWQPAPELTAGSLESAGVLAAVLNLVHAEIVVALDGHPDQQPGDVDSVLPAFTLTSLAFTPQQRIEFLARLRELLDEYVYEGDRAPAGTELYHFFVAGYPVSTTGTA